MEWIKNKKPQWWATFLIILSGVLYGFLGFFGTKILDDDFTVPEMLFWRFFVAFLWMGLFLFVRKKEETSLTHSFLNNILSVFLLGSVFYSTSCTFYFLASQRVGTGLAMVIYFAFPVFVVLYAWLGKKNRVNQYALASLIAILIGLYLLKGQGPTHLSVQGILLAMGSALFYALYIIGNKKNIHALSANATTTFICLGNTLIFFVFTVWTGTFAVPSHFSTWGYIVLLGVFATAIPIQLLLMGLKHMTSTKASILSVLEPVVTVLVGMMLLGETVTQLQILGVIIMLIGATLIQFE